MKNLSGKDMQYVTSEVLTNFLHDNGFKVGDNLTNKNFIHMYDLCINEGYITTIYDLKYIFQSLDVNDKYEDLETKIFAYFEITDNQEDTVYLSDIATKLHLYESGKVNNMCIRNIMSKYPNVKETAKTGNKACYIGMRAKYPVVVK